MTVEPMALAAPLAAPQRVQQPPGRYVMRYGSVRTGQVYNPLPVTSATGSNGQNGEASATMQTPPGTGLYRSLPPVRTMWVLEWQRDSFRRVVAAGPVWQREVSTSGVQLGGGGIFSILARRSIVPPVAAQDVPKSDVSFTGLDYGSIMRGIVAYVTGMAEGSLPITLQAPRAGTRSATYTGYSLTKAGAALLDLAGIDPNTDFVLTPRYTTSDATAVTWDLITGTEATPQLVNKTPHELDGTAAKQAVINDLRVSDSGADLATTAWAKDNGTERSATIRATSDFTLTGSGYPRVDGDTMADTDDPSEVQGWANGLLARTFRPARSVTVSVSAEKWWPLNARMGDFVHVRYNHPELGLLDLTSRVLGESWDIKSQWVDLTLADTLAEDGV